MQDTSSTHRFRALDALRGIAAAAVVVTHCLGMLPAQPLAGKPLLAGIASIAAASGTFAVMIFFVLSGFVLSLPRLRASQPYIEYAVRRFFRLYPPYAFAVFVSAALCTFLTTDASRIGWTFPATQQIIARHLEMTGVGRDSVYLDSPLWSLVIEMRASLIFPLLFLFGRRLGWFGAALGVVAAFLCAKLNALHGASGEAAVRYGTDATGALLLTARYLPLFLFGIVAAVQGDKLQRIVAALPAAVHALICLGIVAGHVLLVHKGVNDHGYGDVFYGLSAVYFIACCTGLKNCAARMTSGALLWLGEISYSLYLIHVPVLYAVLNVLQGRIEPPLGIVIALPLVFAAAQFMHWYVEKPSMLLGKKLFSSTPATPQEAEAEAAE